MSLSKPPEQLAAQPPPAGEYAMTNGIGHKQPNGKPTTSKKARDKAPKKPAKGKTSTNKTGS